MVLVADDFGAWLVALLAEAGRKKMTTVVLGSEQERALRSAARMAVRRTAKELHSNDDEQARSAALVMSQVFSAPVPDSLLATNKTILEAFQTRISKQFAVLDDASLTGTPESSADVLGVSGTELAKKLTGYLLREIVSRGARGEALAPLAAQLNHDKTHLQVKRIEIKVDQLEKKIQRALANIANAGSRSPASVKMRARHYSDGVLVEWTNEGPRVSMFDGTVLSVTEMTALLDMWMDLDKDEMARMHEKEMGKGHPDIGIAILILSASKACYEFYGHFPEEKELKKLSTELARKYDLFWRFMVDIISDAEKKRKRNLTVK